MASSGGEDRTAPRSERGSQASWRSRAGGGGGSHVCSGVVKDLVQRASPCVLRPKCFFVAWNGVLTIAYSGFPPSLASLKSALSAEIDALPPENPGSLWPKTTLAAVKDNRRLTPKQLSALGKICREATEDMSQCSQGKIQVVVDRLSVVFYACRCLERTLFKAECELAGALDNAEPTPESKEFTRQVLDEVNAPDYWYHTSKDGHREAHYRGNAMGLTLVHELGHSSSSTQQYWHQLPGIVDDFRQKIEDQLPGMYTWFANESLHVTIRGLMG